MKTHHDKCPISKSIESTDESSRVVHYASSRSGLLLLCSQMGVFITCRGVAYSAMNIFFLRVQCMFCYFKEIMYCCGRRGL